MYAEGGYKFNEPQFFEYIVKNPEIINLIDDIAYIEFKSELKDKLFKWYLQTSDSTHWKKARMI